MEPALEKRHLRRNAIRLLRSIPSDRMTDQRQRLIQLFPGLPGVEAAKTVMLYLSAFPEEPETWPMARWVLEQGQCLVCPRVDREQRRLRLFRVRDLASDVALTENSLLEPSTDCEELSAEAIDWCLVPGLLFDDDGFRLGRGGGYYDRLLAKLPSSASCWALALDEQWSPEILPREPHDLPLDGVVSPSRIREFPGRQAS